MITESRAVHYDDSDRQSGLLLSGTNGELKSTLRCGTTRMFETKGCCCLWGTGLNLLGAALGAAQLDDCR
jgi:hypothetical protein